MPYAAAAMTPKPVWNPDIDNPIDFFSNWQPVAAHQHYDNAFKAQWNYFFAMS